MATFSEVFGLNRTQPELDFVDIDVDGDMPLFIDPFRISRCSDEWSAQCNNSVVSFFQSVLDAIRSGDSHTARRLLNGLGEPNETCLGLSRALPRGRGVSGKQANDLYNALSASQAVRTGFIREISDCELMVQGIGYDKISDVTTNIIRSHLIEYTQAQCRLHGITLSGTVASGRLWDSMNKTWTSDYTQLPTVNGRRILLVPKAMVGWNQSIDHRKYYRHFVLNFLQQEHLSAGSSLVQLLRNGKKRVTKKSLKQRYPCSKEFLFEFSKRHPEVLEAYKASVARNTGRPLAETNATISEATLAEGLRERLRSIPAGTEHASDFHSLMVGLLEFLFYPDLMNPRKEAPIHDGRKRIDITYTNSAHRGFFNRVHTSHNVTSNYVMVECKNYNQDPTNPELDQLSGRFSPNRGRLGILVLRKFEDRNLFLERCRDTARDGRGFIIPLADEDLHELLDMVARGLRSRIDEYLDRIFWALCS